MVSRNIYLPWRQVLKAFIPGFLLALRRNLIGLSNPYARRCEICGYEGKFQNAGVPIRVGVLCPSCKSLERHRLLHLRLLETKLKEPILHFAAEDCLSGYLRQTYAQYETADYFSSSDLKLDIQSMDLPDSKYRSIICNHVLEHVDDNRALAEIRRVLSDQGELIVSVPLVSGLEKTYRPAGDFSDYEKQKFFGQHDHLRLYGEDFCAYVEKVGFKCVSVIRPTIEEYYACGLNFDDVIFRFKVVK